MNGSLKLTLAVALALGSTNVLALGLGMIQVKSGLNEPLVAEIPVTGGPDETASVSVALAAAADFERVGLSRARIVVPLEFTLATGAKGNAVIKVTTKDAVRDPFLDFLIEVNWSKGKLLREYTVLLDPPTMAPAIKGSRASTAPVRDGTTPAASTQLPATKPPAKTTAKPVRGSDTASTPPAAPSPTPERTAASGEYGPVAAGETLSEVAASTRPDESVSVNQVMIALLRANPNAFYRDNINSLKRGAIMRVPSADEIRAAGSAAAAAAEVRNQNEAARGGAAAPTLVADTGSRQVSSSTSSSTAATKPSDRLELVPPRSGKDSSASAERPGAGGTGDSSVRAELARAKEALASSNQEAGELKSRVRELEELKTKNDKLLTLKDSELAALQQKLKELQSAKPATSSASTSTPPPTATPPASRPVVSTPPATTTVTAPKSGEKALTKEEIWGAAAGTPPGTSTPAGATTPATASPTPPGTTPAAPTPTPPASSTVTPPASVTSPSTTSTTSPTTAPDGSAATPASTPPVSTTPPDAAATTPSTPAVTPAPPTTTPAKPATSTTVPAKPSTPAKVQPLPTAKPWYSDPNIWMYGLGGLAVLGALGFLASRLLGKKTAPAAAGGAAYAEATSPLQDEEDALLDRLAQYPDDTSAHLELTSLYYSQGDADKFEAAAQAMYAHIYDTNMPEWQQVQAMGRELVPTNPLFAEPLAASAPSFGNYDAAPEPMRFDGFDDSFGAPPPAARPADDDAFDFDLADRSAPTVPPPSAARDDFSFDLTPPPAPAPSNYQTQVQPLPPIPDLAPPPSRIDDDLLASDDAIGTKLDLAKAYLDMGDPDGARSMLEEVLIEGSESQKGEARKLLAEIR
ncbi:FimV/HubP family polar landmark protein [Tahibacter sp.]|uniref:FimV/HubP family polar landmark protein n=1 Tax=Tahibacter sp. TaxID=2056211 RepID=UPI0028C4181E|nr:FimV/HubP family polar landmark protein [Tahibacter sp.]